MRLLLLSLLLPIALRAQHFDDFWESSNSRQAVLALSAGSFASDLALVNKQLSLYGAAAQLGETYQAIGIDGAGCRSRLGKAFDYGFSVQAVLPQRVAIGAREEAFRFTGWQAMLHHFGKDVMPGKTFAFIVTPGISFGSLRIRRRLEPGENLLYRNPFIAPYAAAELRMVVWNIALGVRASYRFDLSKDTWKRDVDNLSELPGAKNHGLGIQVFVGRGYKRE